MATTTDALLDHLAELRQSVSAAIEAVNGYRTYGAGLTADAKAAQLGKITTVPEAREHASDCPYCVGWAG